MAQLKVGDKAPAFTLLDQESKKVKLSDFKGRQVLVYVAKYDAIATRIEELRQRIGVTGTASAAAEWIGSEKRLRRAWDQKLSMDEKRALLAAVVGPSKVLPAARPGRYATPDEVKARLAPLGESFGT